MATDRTPHRAANPGAATPGAPAPRAPTPGTDGRRRARVAPGGALTAALQGAGGGLLIAAAAIHLDLYVTGYRSIPTIGGLFLFQVIVGFLLAAAILATGRWPVAAGGAAFALATLGGYLLSVWVGLFGFKEVSTTAGIAAGVVEVAAFAALAALAVRLLASGQRTGLPALDRAAAAWLDVCRVSAVTLIGGAAAIALVLLGVAAAGAAGPSGPASAGATLKTATSHGTTVLTNASGFTLYWFAPDTPSRSNCTGVCAQYWPPVTGPATAGPGVAGTLATITRTGGATQATYDGHPLYTYIGDTAPGQANGNNLNLNGGLWHEVTVPG
jgi:predicted lipoprotein with Yx(FWY)xxD motif